MNFFIGVIEDRKDPEQLGRFRVRVLGLHTVKKNILPTTDLPWATVITPSGGNSGLGSTPPFFVEGTWVYVTFRDGDNQEPLIHGALAGKPSLSVINMKGFDKTRGFQDPDGVYPLKADESDINELARGSLTAANPVARDVLRKTNVATADFDEISKEQSASGLAVTGSPGGSFSLPSIVSGTYAPEYPFNKVFASETGHVLEFDDTTDKRRVHLSHASGSYFEYSNDGDLVSHIVKDKYDIVNSDSYIAVSGSEVHSIDGSLKVFANKGLTSGANYDIEVGSGASINIMVRDGDMNMHIKGNVNQSLDGDFNVSCDNFTVDASNKVTIEAGDVMLLDSNSEVDINGNPINLN